MQNHRFPMRSSKALGVVTSGCGHRGGGGQNLDIKSWESCIDLAETNMGVSPRIGGKPQNGW